MQLRHALTPAARLALLVTTLPLLASCTSSGSGSTQSTTQNTQATTSGPRQRPIALIANQPLFPDTIQPQIAELAGGLAIEEFALDTMLDKALASEGKSIDQRAINAERNALVDAMAQEAKVSPDEATQMLARVRIARGLGPARFDQLLARNAKLRLLAREQVTITPDMIAREEAFLNGPRVRIRIAVLPTQVAASTFRTNALAAPAGEQRTVRFASLALEQSVDTSAAAGGLITNVSPADPSLPPALRNALALLQPTQVSDVLALPSGFGVVLHEGASAPGTPIDSATVESKLRSKLERLAMDAITKQYVKSAQVRILDPNFAWSWESRAAGQ